MNPRLIEVAQMLSEIMAPSTEGLLREQLDLAQRQIQQLKLEDEGWTLLTGGKPEDEGPDLDQIKEMSKLLRPAVATSPLPKQANNLRSSYIFSEKFIIPNLEGSTETAEDAPGGKKTGRPTAEEAGVKRLKKFASSRTAREYVFGKEAQELISTACSTDGMYLLLGKDDTKEVHALSLTEITGTMVNPDHPGEVWAYQRTWDPTPSATNNTVQKKWYYTDKFTGTREESLGGTKKRGGVPVSPNETIIDLSVNNQTGWAFGVPDLWPGHVWNRNYLAAIKDGMEVSSLMAWLSAKVKNQSPAGSANTGAVIGNAGSGAHVQSIGPGNSVDTYATTGKAYDYDATRPLAAIYALAAGVSVVDLLASPSAAGASYGSAQALAPGMKRSVAVRRDRIAAWLERVLEWATGMYHTVTPAAIDEIEPYRKMQVAMLAWNSGLFHPDEVRPELGYIANITLKHDAAPEGVLVPNNEASLRRKDIDADTDQKPNDTTPAADQGKSDGTGGTGNDSGNDQRTDQLTK